ncbi:unnamed protein product [Rotaria magnacalcarata]|uniref:Carbohydrate kinase PfkB domain-containing protein n=3 Tax=Rotaria magnacalcarata TaxID=392030 RepID=A0A817A9P7_9BILA|nr:unnamed protein product [Rotaria magnacalcarata]CAF4167380.1 unnamed protein product [Rotaria magnacalcarata]
MQRVKRLLLSSYHCRQIRTFNSSIFDINPEVKSALNEHRPIVACETAILTHGLPRPSNIETCLKIEQIIRENGSIPATIAILNGRIKVGLTQTELEQLGSSNNVEKASRRDLPYLISRHAFAGTTVAATMLIAHRCGIPLFATGGIGGVHRDSTTTGDISSDLDELGRTPVCVISSGVKSILDIPKTLEYLETKGVGVYTFGDTNEFPNFFTRSNEFGSCSCAAIRTIDEAARLVRTMIDLKLGSGLLLAVPIDKEDELEVGGGEKIESVIRESLALATQGNITGNQVTPFVLSEIRRQTGNKSIITNQKLIYKNARIASQIAVALSSTKSNSPSSLIIIGARNIDLHIQLNADFTPHKGSTIPCRVRQNFGGVAYNVTHALHLLKNHSIRLLTVAGRSNLLRKHDSTPTLIHEIEDESTASYISLLDSKTNELICGFGDMEIYERQITPSFLDRNLSILINSQWIMFDANLSQIAMKYLIDTATKYKKNSVFISAGGPNKARRIKPYLKDINVLFCNRLEFEAITESSSIEASLKKLVRINSNLKLICITIGSQGVLISINGQLKKYKALITEKDQHDIQNVTGAGDSFAAGVMNQLLKTNFNNIDRAIACGLLSAKFTLKSANTISEQLKTIDDTMIDEICLKELKYENIDS